MIFFNITVHMIVKNEDQYVGYALASVLPYVSHAIISDTGSGDKTVSNIQYQVLRAKEVNPNIKIIFEEHKINQAIELAQLRKKQLENTKTEWFLIVDGDEVWPQKELFKLLQLIKELPKDKVAVVNNVRECAGDVWHYLSTSFGKYRFFGKMGHYNIRLMKNLPYEIMGEYPNEAYCLNGIPVNTQEALLQESDVWYLHMTHLIRSSFVGKTMGRRKIVFSRGVAMSTKEIPEVMQTVEWKRRSVGYEIKARIFDLLRLLKK